MDETIRCQRCRHPLGAFTARGWRFHRAMWIDIEAGVARIKCANRDPFRRGACGAVTVAPVRVELRQVEPETAS